MSVSRFGFHMQPTTLVIQFDGPLDAASAQNVKDYKIVGPSGRHIAVASAVYNANTMTVTLSPVTRLNVHYTYHLIVRGTGSDPIKDRAGTPSMEPATETQAATTKPISQPQTS